MTNILQSDEFRRAQQNATEGGVKLFFRALAWGVWAVVSFIKEMFRMVFGK